MNEKIEKLEQIIGYSFQDKMLVKRALTHTSFSNEQKINKNVMLKSVFHRMSFCKGKVCNIENILK